MLEPYETNGKKKLTGIVAGVLLLGGAVIGADWLRGKSVASSGTTTAPEASTPAATPQTSTGGFKDGTFSATSTYRVPHGSESIRVTLTLRGGVVTNSTVQNSENDRESASYQEDFASQYQSGVVGQKISDLNLDSVAGASDTTSGFNEAVAQIAQQAQA
jgi:uncharacterized protein with FMN-binding domain